VVDPIDYLYAEKEAVNKGIGLLGIFHSHPDHPAVPSEHDLAAAHPFFSYTIVSVLAGKVGDIKSYQLQGDCFEEELVELPVSEAAFTTA
jgi:proteasome lid subunit RPN8/RPN11